jgi:hypothetical protein
VTRHIRSSDPRILTRKCCDRFPSVGAYWVVSQRALCSPGNVQPVYPLQLQIPGSPININAPRAVGFPLAATQGIIALIGRDVLQFTVLVYNGSAGSISLSV